MLLELGKKKKPVPVRNPSLQTFRVEDSSGQFSMIIIIGRCCMRFCQALQVTGVKALAMNKPLLSRFTIDYV